MIPIEEFKNDGELDKLKIGSVVSVYLERIESLKVRLLFQERKREEWSPGNEF